MHWLALVSGALAISISNKQAAIRSKGDQVELEYTGFDRALDIGPDQVLDVKFSFKGEVLPHQAFISVKGPSGKYQSAPAKIRKNVARASFPFDKFEEGISEARAYIAASDGKDISAPLQITAIAPKKTTGTPQHDAKQKFAEENKIAYRPQPEILHEFKAPPRMVSAPVAIIFAGAVWGLFFGLVVTWNSQLGLKVGAVPFVGSLAAIEAVFLAYYYTLSIFSAIFYSVLIGAAAVVLGNKALSTLPDVEGSAVPDAKNSKSATAGKEASAKNVRKSN